MKILFVWPNKDSFGYKPISLSLFSAIAKESGFQTRLFDTTTIDFGFGVANEFIEAAKIVKPIDLTPYELKKKRIDLRDSFKKTLDEYKPDLLACSVLSDEYFIATEISKISKEISPSVPIIWGGKYATLNPEKTLREHFADYVCIGEGLDAFVDFTRALNENKDVSNIPNIWAKSSSRIIKNTIRPLRRNLDNLPYVDWSIFDKRHFYKPFDGTMYLSAGDHMLNWGCPYRCTYCINDFYHKFYHDKYFMRRYSTQRIIAELKYLKEKYNLDFFKFHDEDFLMRPVENLCELSQAYKEAISIPFTIETNPKSVTPKKVKLLKDMNCVSVSLAIETGDPALRKNLLKRVDTEAEVIRAFTLFKEAGIRTVSFNMLGIPFESRSTYEKTIQLNRKAKVQYPDMGFFYPFEGTLLREISIRGGFFNPTGDKRDVYHRDKPQLHFAKIRGSELIEMRNAFVLYVKLPRSYHSFIKRSEKQDGVGVKLRKKILTVYDKTVWENSGWYKDDGLKNRYLQELKDIVSRK